MKLKPTPTLLTLLIFLLTACASGATAPAPTVTVTLPAPTATMTSIPTASATLGAQQPPACTFPLAQTTTAESTPEKYTFSEPKVVSNSNAGIEIVEWLPDSQRALVTQNISNTSKENIELFNPQTGEADIYAVRGQDMWHRPVWVEKLNAIIYPESLRISSSFNNNGMVIPSSIVERHLLWLSNGKPANSQILEDVEYNRAVVPHERVTSSLDVKPDGSQVVYLKNTGEIPWRLYSRMISQNGLGTEQQSGIQGNYGGEGVRLDVSNKMTWRTGTPQIFFYSFASATNQTFLLDTDTGQVCTLSFGGWVYFARWSPNGRYLAVIKSLGPNIPTGAGYDLVVLDTTTGKLYQIDSTKVGPPEMKDCCIHIVEDVAWAPDNRHLAVIGTAGYTGTSTYELIDRLYLVDFLSGEIDNLFPSYEFISNYFGSGLAWSQDGTKLLATCSTMKEGRLCLVPVHVGGQ